MASLDSFKCRKIADRRGQDLRVSTRSKAAEKNGPHGRGAAAVLAQDRARESPAQRGRPHRHQGGHPGGRRLARTTAARPEHEIAFRPARVLMQDFTGVPAVVDLAAMRDAMTALGGNPQQDQSARPGRSRDRPLGWSSTTPAHRSRSGRTSHVEYEQNQERYRFLKWGQQAFSQFLALCRPAPASATRSTSNIFAQTVWTSKRSATARRSRWPIRTRSSAPIAIPPWSTASPCSAGASAASRRRRRCSASRSPCCCPEVIGFKPARRTARGRHRDRPRADRHPDAAQERGAVGKFVEFFGPGLNAMTVADRATLADRAIRICLLQAYW